MKSASRLPSITILLSIIGAALLLPLGSIAITQWQQAEHRYDAAVQVGESADRLDSLIRLAPAIDRENRSTTWNSGGEKLLGDLPPDIVGVLGTDYGASMMDDRAAVDALVSWLGDDALMAELADVRRSADAGNLGLFDSAARFDVVGAEVEMQIHNELTRLGLTASEAGDDSIAEAARVAEATAALQIAASGQHDKWSQLRVSEFLAPAPSDVTGFATNVGLLRDRMSAVDQVIDPNSAAGQNWEALRSSPETAELFELYDATILNFTLNGLPASDVQAEQLDLTNVAITDLLAVAVEVNTSRTTAESFDAQLATVGELTLNELDAAGKAGLDDAQADRNRTLLWLLTAAGLVVLGVVALVVLIARPVRKMADVAEQLSVGQLDVHLEESGPTEIRNSARAMNQALESLRNTEAQAVALAEERLDDPILEARSVGGIGESLQTAVARLATSLTERESFQQKLAHEAAHDGLTKISNRNAILRHLDAALARTRRSSSSLAILFLDIDDFKTINDVHGHQAGDAVLRNVATRLVGVIRDGDLAGRMGGDEFVVVAEAVEDIDEALRLSDRIVSAISEPVTFDGGTFEPSLSIGVAIADGELSADELLRDADLAVYRAKSLGKGRTEVCDEDLRGEVRERETIERELEAAIDDGQFVLHFQPSVDAINHKITSFEALIRWNHPTRGVVGPMEFIPIAERTNLIARIDRWVLDAASAQLAAWTDHPDFGSHPVAVNISGRHLGSGTLTDDVLDALNDHEVDPRRMLLEVTETALLADLVTAGRELTLLREAGVRVALDDFGTGYMSLSHLRGLPVDVLKIDQTFIAEMADDSDHPLIKLIIDTGHLLGVDVTAEGVETSTQASTLTAMGVDSLQGRTKRPMFSAPGLEPVIL